MIYEDKQVDYGNEDDEGDGTLQNKHSSLLNSPGI
jgi:hypothetical protein